MVRGEEVKGHLFQQDRHAQADGVFESAEKAAVRQFDDLQAVLRLSGADPAVRLKFTTRISNRFPNTDPH